MANIVNERYYASEITKKDRCEIRLIFYCTYTKQSKSICELISHCIRVASERPNGCYVRQTKNSYKVRPFNRYNTKSKSCIFRYPIQLMGYKVPHAITQVSKKVGQKFQRGSTSMTS